MPEIGEIRRATEIGRRSLYCVYIWHACISCGRGSWVQLVKGKPRSLRCGHCARIRWYEQHPEALSGKNNPRWKGGRWRRHDGYMEIHIPEDSPWTSMRNYDGYIAEHRLVMAEHLGRCLELSEFVHHKNGIKNDNRLENLQLISAGSHIAEHNRGYQDGYRQGLADGKDKQIIILKNEISRLKKLLKTYKNTEYNLLAKSIFNP